MHSSIPPVPALVDEVNRRARQGPHPYPTNNTEGRKSYLIGHHPLLSSRGRRAWRIIWHGCGVVCSC